MTDDEKKLPDDALDAVSGGITSFEMRQKSAEILKDFAANDNTTTLNPEDLKQ